MLLIRAHLAVGAEIIKPTLATDGVITARLQKSALGTRCHLMVSSVYIPGQTDRFWREVRSRVGFKGAWEGLELAGEAGSKEEWELIGGDCNAHTASGMPYSIDEDLVRVR